MRRALVGACLLLGCARTATVESASPEPAPPVERSERASAEASAAAETDPVAEAFARVKDSGVALDGGWLSDDDVERLAQTGLTPEGATAALEVLALRCKDQRTPVCGHSGDEKYLREMLVEWLADRGDVSSAPVLLRLDHYGDYAAGRALENALTRRMEANLKPCAAPTEAEVAAVRTELGSFVVLDHRSGRLFGRAATAAELDDLAYFLAAVADNGAPVGEEVDSLRSGATPTEDEQRERTNTVAVLEHAEASGDAAQTLQAGSDYLHALGYPGPIDLSREVEMAWGGARFSYVMRDVALAAELEGEPALAAALYRRANPGGGACGTSTSGRRTDQIMGTIRSEEALGRCEAVVAERLVNREGRKDSAYGPARLSAAGYDLARLYRGALVTRHRDRDSAEVEAAIGRAPAGVREAGLARLSARGSEAWEQRVWAVEGLASEIGRPGVEHLVPLVDHVDPALRARLISAVGRGAKRPYSGTCNPDGLIGLGLSGSNIWSRRVERFGDDCSTWLNDAEANAMARQLIPHLDADLPALRQATAEALGNIAAPVARPALGRTQRRDEKAERRCEARDGDECWRMRDVADAARDSLESLDRAAVAMKHDPFEGMTEEG